VANPLSLGSTVTFGGTDALTFTGNGALSANTTLSAANTTTLSGKISGAFSLANSGAGTLVLSGNNDFSGGFNQTAGTLQLGNNNAVGTGTLKLTGGTIQATGGSRTLANTLSFDGDMTFAGTDALTLSGDGILTSSRTLTINSGTTTTLSGDIAQSGAPKALTKAGSGTLVLSGDNTYYQTTLNAGTLRIGSDTALGTGNFIITAGTIQATGGSRTLNIPLTVSGNMTFSGSDDLTFNSGFLMTANRTLTVNNSTTFKGNITQNTSGRVLTKAGTGTLTLSGNNSFSGGLTLSAGTLRLGSNTGAGSGTLNLNGGTVQAFNGDRTLANTVSLGGNLTFSGTDDLNFNNATLTGNRTLTVNNTTSFGGTLGENAGGRVLTVQGSGALALSGNNTFSGGLTLSDATLRLGSDTALGSGTFNFNGGRIEPVGAGRILANPVNFGGDAAIGGSYGMTFNGTAVLTGNRVLTIEALTEFPNGLGENGGSYSLDRMGTGTLVFSGNSGYSGATHLYGGATVVNGSLASSSITLHGGATLGGSGSVGPLTVQSGGILSPGNSPGSMTLGSATWEGGGHYLWEINDANGSRGGNPGWDSLNIQGSLDISATSGNKFNVDLTSLTLANTAGAAENFDSSQSRSWTILTAQGGINGFDADKFNLDASGFSNLLNGGQFSLSQNGNDLNLSFNAVPEPRETSLAAAAALLVFGFVRHRAKKRRSDAEHRARAS
jgi:autotransporter-associated beta strand protein